MTNFNVRVVDTNEVSPQLWETFCGLWGRIWPPDPNKKDDPDSQDTMFCNVVIEDENSKLVGVCSWINREILVDGNAQRIAGLAGVAVEEEFRGQGLGKMLLQTAIDEAKQRGYEWGVLFCPSFRQTFYEQFGWRVLRGEITQTHFSQEVGIFNDDLVMALPLTTEAAKQWPQWEKARIHVGVGQW